MVENENETLRDRVSDLEKRVHDQNDEITCLRATLADALRRINTLEAGKGNDENLFYIYLQRNLNLGCVISDSFHRFSFSKIDFFYIQNIFYFYHCQF